MVFPDDGRFKYFSLRGKKFEYNPLRIRPIVGTDIRDRLLGQFNFEILTVASVFSVGFACTDFRY